VNAQDAFTFHNDAGHGWIEVPLADLRELGIDRIISSYSYERDGRVYLEEDCDASTFVKAYQDRFGREPELVDRYHRGDAPMRSFPCYNGGTDYSWETWRAFMGYQ
jgi:hypothetical protein